MVDTLTKLERSERMARIRSEGSQAELVVRRMLYACGYRYRLHRRDLPGTPDIVFARRKRVILVHGCFWHRHEDPKCRLARLPKSNLEFWLLKFESNKSRDRRQASQLTALGWKTHIVWECEIRDRKQLENDLRRFIEAEG